MTPRDADYAFALKDEPPGSQKRKIWFAKWRPKFAQQCGSLDKARRNDALTFHGKAMPSGTLIPDDEIMAFLAMD